MGRALAHQRHEAHCEGRSRGHQRPLIGLGSASFVPALHPLIDPWLAGQDESLVQQVPGEPLRDDIIGTAGQLRSLPCAQGG